MPRVARESGALVIRASFVIRHPTFVIHPSMKLCDLTQFYSPVSGGVKFECIVANPQTPDRQRHYQVERADLVSAVRAVLAEIDQTR